MFRHSNEKSHQCSHSGCKAVKPSNLKKHIMVPYTCEKSHQCPHCEYRSVQIDLDCLQNEIYRINIPVMHHHAQEKACQHCDSKGSIPSGFEKHMMPCNSFEEHHQCPHCEHRTAHSGPSYLEKPHQCPHCEYKSVRKGDLKEHMMFRHSNEKSHQCSSHCGYKFFQVSKLQKHIMARHTNEKSHQCLHCEHKSVRIDYFNQNIMAHHTTQNPYQCPHCECKSVKIDGFNQHIMTYHTAQKPVSMPPL
nr:zinc finger protein 711-like [Halyomorpha halys]